MSDNLAFCFVVDVLNELVVILTIRKRIAAVMLLNILLDLVCVYIKRKLFSVLINEMNGADYVVKAVG